MDVWLIWVAVVTASFVGRIAEYRVHRVNYRALKQAGAEELDPWLMRLYYSFHFLVLPVCVIEQLVTAQEVFREMLVGGLLALLAGHGLRFWSIGSLGSMWTMSCIGLKGIRATNRGPYRVMANPEYISRIIDVIGLSLVFGSRFTGIVMVVLSVLLARRVWTVEERQLQEFGSLSTRVRHLPQPS